VLRVVVISGAAVGLGWFFWKWEIAEREVKRMGFGKGVGQEVADRVAAKRRRPEWERKLSAYWRLGETRRVK
jgi:hypothetical protein